MKNSTSWYVCLHEDENGADNKKSEDADVDSILKMMQQQLLGKAGAHEWVCHRDAKRVHGVPNCCLHAAAHLRGTGAGVRLAGQDLHTVGVLHSRRNLRRLCCLDNCPHNSCH